MRANITISSGALCHRVPTRCRDWVVDAEFRLLEASFHFTFSDDFFPPLSHDSVVTISFIHDPSNRSVTVFARGTICSGLCTFAHSRILSQI
jgi:hypothetical protein